MFSLPIKIAHSALKYAVWVYFFPVTVEKGINFNAVEAIIR